MSLEQRRGGLLWMGLKNCGVGCHGLGRGKEGNVQEKQVKTHQLQEVWSAAQKTVRGRGDHGGSVKHGVEVSSALQPARCARCRRRASTSARERPPKAPVLPHQYRLCRWMGGGAKRHTRAARPRQHEKRHKKGGDGVRTLPVPQNAPPHAAPPDNSVCVYVSLSTPYLDPPSASTWRAASSVAPLF